MDTKWSRFPSSRSRPYIKTQNKTEEKNLIIDLWLSETALRLSCVSDWEEKCLIFPASFSPELVSSHSFSLPVASPCSLLPNLALSLTLWFPHRSWYSQMSLDKFSSCYFLHSSFLLFAAAKALVHTVATFQLDTATSRFPTSSFLPPTFCSQSA